MFHAARAVNVSVVYLLRGRLADGVYLTLILEGLPRVLWVRVDGDQVPLHTDRRASNKALRTPAVERQVMVFDPVATG